MTRSPVTCQTCGGDGFTLEMGHAPECWGNCVETESGTCPVQVQAECRDCGGSGVC